MSSEPVSMSPKEYMQHCLRTWHQKGDKTKLSKERAEGLTYSLANILPFALKAESQKKFVFQNRGAPPVTDETFKDASESLKGWIFLAQRLPHAFRCFHALVGVIGEWVEVLQHIPGDDEAKDELGDLLYYVTVLVHEHGLTLEEVMQHNVDKLTKRYPPESAQ